MMYLYDEMQGNFWLYGRGMVVKINFAPLSRTCCRWFSAFVTGQLDSPYLLFARQFSLGVDTMTCIVYT